MKVARIPQDQPSATDADLERRIREAEQDLAKTGSRAAWARLQGLVGQRSAAQIARLERAKGLA